MARANANDAGKAPAIAVNTTAATETQEPSGVADSNAAAVAGTGTGPVLPADPANGIGSTVQAGQPSADGAGTVADVAATGTSTISVDATSAAGDQLTPTVVAEDSSEITIYPLRSYLDGKEVRRAGGKGYKSPKHDAVSLIAAGLATDKQPKS